MINLSMSKWIKVREGHWRTVPDDYNAPENAPADKPGVPAIISKAPWSSLEAGVHSDDAHTQVKATDAFLDERKKWASSGKWASWESSRKAEWAKNKPAWRKEQMQKGLIDA